MYTHTHTHQQLLLSIQLASSKPSRSSSELASNMNSQKSALKVKRKSQMSALAANFYIQ